MLANFFFLFFSFVQSDIYAYLHVDRERKQHIGSEATSFFPPFFFIILPRY